jgi:hypothetical protein
MYVIVGLLTPILWLSVYIAVTSYMLRNGIVKAPLTPVKIGFFLVFSPIIYVAIIVYSLPQKVLDMVTKS